MKRTSAVLAVMALMGMCMVACLPSGEAEPSAAELPVVRYVNFQVYDPVYVALEKGLFEKHGIKVEMIGSVLAGPTAIQAVASGKAEFGLSSYMAIINANAQGLPVIGTSDIQSELPEQTLETFFVRADSGINTVADLKGKTIAINLIKSSFHYTWMYAFEQAGIDFASVKTVVLPFGSQAAALDTGEVDAIGLIVPHTQAALSKYGDKFKILMTGRDVFGPRQFTTHFVNRIWAQAYPERARAFTQAVDEAIAYIETHQDDARQIVGEYTKIDPGVIPDYHFQPGGRVNLNDAQFWLDWMKRDKSFAAPWLTVDDIATNDYHTEKVSP